MGDDRGRRRPGRPTQYDPSMIERAERLVREHGMTREMLATALGCSVWQLARWMRRYPELRDAIRAARDDYDSGLVEVSLRRRATGYTVREVVRDSEGNTIKEVIKEIPPDPTSMIFWLKNRQPSRWRDRQQVEHTGLIYLAPEPVDKPADAGLSFSTAAVLPGSGDGDGQGG